MEPHFLGTSYYKSPIGLVVKVSIFNLIFFLIPQTLMFETSFFAYVWDMHGLHKWLFCQVFDS